ncbi:unnamed protein product [Symbiodinium sp. CCMP2592]|nr:unnamed protein product [Symbiodinium sp. CCMP2592]
MHMHQDMQEVGSSSSQDSWQKPKDRFRRIGFKRPSSTQPSAGNKLARARPRIQGPRKGAAPRLILGVAEDAGEAELGRAFEQRKQECGPGKVPAETSEAAKEVWQAMKSAYEAIRSEKESEESVAHRLQDMDLGKAFSSAVFRTLFLPRDLPGEEEATSDVVATLASVAPTWTVRMQEFVFNMLHTCGYEHLQRTISSLTQGMASAFWIRAQNAILHIERRSETVARLSAWRVQLPLAEAMRTEAVWMQLPAVATDVPWHVVDDDAFYRLVGELVDYEFPDAARRSEKKHAQVQETWEPNSPTYVLDYLLPASGGETVVLAEGDAVWEQVFDEVRHQPGGAPWRSSPAWAAFRTALHLECCRTASTPEIGELTFKTMLLQISFRALRHVEMTGSRDAPDASAQLEAARKLVLQALELEAAVEKASAPQNLETSARNAVADARDAAQMTLQHLEAEWESIANRELPCTIYAAHLNFDRDEMHQLKHSEPCIQKVMAWALQGQHGRNQQVTDPPCCPRAGESCDSQVTALKAVTAWPSDSDRMTALYDAENWISAAWHSQAVFQADAFRELMTGYLELSGRIYKGDPEGQSRRCLMATTMVLMVDRAACREFPVLKEHSIGVEISMLHVILTPHLEDRKLLHALECYVQERENVASYPSTICAAEVSASSFSVRFAKAEMEDVRADIQEQCLQNQAAKAEEVRTTLSRHREMLEKFKQTTAAAEVLSCEYDPGRRHSRKCKKCATKKQANVEKDYANKMHVDIYEKLLPEDENEQRAVVYELQQPAILALQRDSILLLAREIGAQGDFYSDRSRMVPWRQDPCLSGWRRVKDAAFSLGSSSKKFRDSRYKKCHVLKHKTFIVPHGYNLVLLDEKKWDEEGKNIVSSRWRWSVERPTKVSTNDERYEALDGHVASWKENDNKAIAMKSAAHPDITLLEFETFGMLRSGVRLQLPRLMYAIAQHCLSFQRLGVLNMLKALLWQVGPASENSLQEASTTGNLAQQAVLRQASACLLEDDLALKLCTHIALLLETSRKNWTHNRTLLFVITLGRFLAEHCNPRGSAAAHGILRSARSVGLEWVATVKEILSHTSDVLEAARLRDKIVDIAAATALTFLSSPLPGVTQTACLTEESLLDWLTVRAACYETMLSGCLQEESLSSERRQLVRNARCVALSLEHQLHRTMVSNLLTKFVRRHWAGGRDGTYGEWQCCKEPCSRWYKTTYERTCVLHLDVLGGSFLVNGKPVGLLPSQITGSRLYSRLFGNHRFQVRPTPQGSYVSDIQNSACFTFDVNTDGTVMIKEERSSPDGAVSASVVPHDAFRNDVPAELVENYSHWLVPKPRPTIYFRPISFKDPKFELGCSQGAAFVLDLCSRTIRSTGCGQLLIDIGSATFQELFKAFGRLALRDHVHVFSGSPSPRVFLPDLQIHFNVHHAGGSVELRSHEMQGTVAADQNLRTLIGLEHGLLLERGNEKMLLLPHASTVCHKEDKHRSVKLELDKVRSPPFFVYTLRPHLQDLHGPKDRLAWIYLAKLHALTSHVLPDPFLERTGTVTALDLLRSARCRGNLPELHEKMELGTAERTLVEIARASPERSPCGRFGRVAERADFHDMLGLCAHEGLAFLSHQALTELREQCQFTGKCPKSLLNALDETGLRCGSLSQRAYLRSREAYGLPARLRPEEEEAALLQQSKPRAPVLWQEVVEKEAAKVREVAAVTLGEGSVHFHSLLPLLCTSEDLPGISQEYLSSIASWDKLAQEQTLRPAWIALCEAALRVNCQRRVGFMLAFLAKQWPEPQTVAHLKILASIACHAEEFRPLQLPRHARYQRPDKFEPESQEVETITKRHQMCSEVDLDEDRSVKQAEKLRKRFEENCKKELSLIVLKTGLVFSSGGCMDRSVYLQTINDTQAFLKDIDAYLTRLRQACDLRGFLKKVESKLQTPKLQPDKRTPTSELALPTRSRLKPMLSSPMLPEPELGVAASSAALQRFWDTGKLGTPVTLSSFSTKTQAPLLSLAPDEEYAQINKELIDPLLESWKLAHEDQSLDHDLLDSTLREKLRRYLREAEAWRKKTWQHVRDALQGQGDWDDLLRQCGLHETPVPLTALPRLLNAHDSPLCVAIGAFAVCLRAEQRALRCLRLLEVSGMSAWLRQELDTGSTGSTTWAPAKHPEWLLLEVDNDFCIREQQVLVAKHMMPEKAQSTEELRNSLMQLNMGEGKTSVIVPLLIASLADGQKLLRVTVLSSLRQTNAADWQHKIGGLLGQRVYPMLCRRDLKLEDVPASCLHRMLHRVRQGRHIIVTVPDHRLSLENKAIELAYTGNLQASEGLHSVLDLLKTHVRDVLDESDEILHAKYQLIYTLGNPQEFDGGGLRWRVASSVLALVARRSQMLAETFGQAAVEFTPGSPTFQFPSVRLLEHQTGAAVYQQLCDWIVDDLLASEHSQLSLKICGEKERQAFRECALVDDARGEPWLILHETLQPIAFLLRGLLCHGVLQLALCKRWRVDFGRHPAGRCRMAVPFRAKDVAAERSEFGHPDVAMLLTLITYYRGGLDDHAMKEVFGRLARKDEREAAATYRKWTGQMGEAMPTELRDWSGVNLDDKEMLHQQLFPALMRHCGVVDFWLGEVVFPVEAKQFPQKLVATPWDLCPLGPLTTGFSGTDDIRPLLPTTIRQSNLAQLAHTNGLVLRNLMREENQGYVKLPHDASGKAVLAKLLADPSINVLLDAGALVTDMSNQEMAQSWLESRRDGKEAAIFFDTSNVASVVNRSGQVIPLAVSPYERCLDKCLLYLDDVHCRGCDFRMHCGSKAAVTLGRGMQKDKLVQACMRMRLLGSGHSVAFFASFEVDLQVQAYLRKPALRNCHCRVLSSILSWCLTNAAKAVADKLPYWAAQGATRIRKEAAYTSRQDLAKLAATCAMNEVLLLKDMYGHARSKETLPDIVNCLLRPITAMVPAVDSPHARSLLTQLQVDVQRRVESLASKVTRPASLLDEEQERELEVELEEERQIERPGPAQACKPRISPGVQALASTGYAMESFCSIGQLLQQTSFPHWGWANENVKVTPDFMQTVDNNGCLDAYLRPAMWLLKGRSQQVIISNFEAEHFANMFSTRPNARLVLVGRRLRPHQAPVCDAPLSTSVHVFAGSLYGAGETLQDPEIEKQRSFLSISCPVVKSPEWQSFYDEKLVQRDGFVHPSSREEVASEDPPLACEASPFRSSPVGAVRRLYRARHLGGELPFSPMGIILCSGCD